MVRWIAGRLVLAAVVFVALLAPVLAAPVPVPTTAAGKQFAAWLEVFNIGDAAALDTFLKTHYPTNKVSVDRWMGFRRGTGGFEVVRIGESDETQLTGVVKERDSDVYARFTATVEADAAHTITKLEVLRGPRPPEIPPVARLNEHAFVRALRSRLEAATAQGKFSGSVLVMKGGRVVFNDSFGYADREAKYENDTLTRYRIGSMNKMFTAVAILQLVEAGKIKLDDPLGKYLPDYPNADVAAKVTIAHLLTHTGGTGDVFGPEFVAHRLELRDTKDVLALFGKRGLAFEPGARFAYSNYGFMLLGAVIEKASGEDYYDYVRAHIFKPAKMTRTDSLPENETVEHRSIGYMDSPEGLKPNTDTLPYRGMPAGGGYSTVEDLARFADALTSHRLLNAANTATLTTGKVAMGPYKYGYGFTDAATDDGTRFFGHNGGAPGMSGELRILPDSGYVAVVLSNFDPPVADKTAAFITDRLPVK